MDTGFDDIWHAAGMRALADEATREAVETRPKAAPSSARKRLRELGIRTATDLQYVVKGRARQNAVVRILDNDPVRLQTILQAMKDDEWLGSLQCWHIREREAEEVVKKPGDIFALLDRSDYDKSPAVDA